MPILDSINAQDNGITNYLNLIRAMEAQLRVKAHQKIVDGLTAAGLYLEGNGKLPDYAVAFSGNHAQLGDNLKSSLVAIIDKTYGLAEPPHPFRGAVNPTALAGNYFNEQMIRELLFPHEEEAKMLARAGRADFLDRIEDYAKKYQNELEEKLMRMSAKKILVDNSVEDAKTYLTTNYPGIDPNILNLVHDNTVLIGAYTLVMANRRRGMAVNKEQIKQAILRGLE